MAGQRPLLADEGIPSGVQDMAKDLASLKVENRADRLERMRLGLGKGGHRATADLGDVASFTTAHDLVAGSYQRRASGAPEASPYGRRQTVADGHVSRVLERCSPLRDLMDIAEMFECVYSPTKFARMGSLMVGVATGRRTLQQALDLQKEEELQEAQRQEEVGLGAREIGYAVANLIVGVGLFTVPYAFTLSGWAGVGLVICSSGAMLFTALLLGDVLAAVEALGYKDPSYGVVGTLTFGPGFQPVFTAFGVGEVFLLNVFSLVFMGQSVGPTVGLDVNLVIYTSAVGSVLLGLVPRRYFSIMSVLGLGLTLLAMAAVIATGLLLLPREGEDTTQRLFGLAGLTGVPTTVSAVAVCVGDHAVFPGVYASSSSLQSYKRGMVIGFGMFVVAALGLAAVVYATLGNSLHPVALTNIGLDTHGVPEPLMPAFVAAVCNVGLAVRCLLVLPLFAKPVVSLLQGFVLKLTGRDLSLPPGADSELAALGTHAGRFWGRLALACLSSGLATVCALALSDLLTELETLTCSLFKSVNTLLIPCCCYLRLCSGQLENRPGKKAAICLLVPASGDPRSGSCV